jgi:beta-N-acetylhexosaminidase
MQGWRVRSGAWLRRVGAPAIAEGACGVARGPVQRAAACAALLALLILAGCSGGPAAAGLAQASGNTLAGTATPSPTPASHATTISVGSALLEARARATADAYLAHMTLDEKLGQMMLIETLFTGYNADVDNMVRNLHAGAMIIYGQNIVNPQQLHDYIGTIQAHADLPMLVSMDEEGGVVDRLAQFDGSLPAAQDLAASGNPQQSWQAAARATREMQALGINTNLAPVVDVRTTPDAVEWTRLFGNDPATVDRYAGQFLLGLQQNGEVGCLKHWPGIGSSVGDPHLTLPTLSRSRAQLESTDFAAFRNLLALQPGMIMVTHVLVPAIDPNLPATLSPTLVQGVLRGELGYDGVVMTDSLYMKGITLRYNLGEAAVLSVIAGDDLLEGAWDSSSMTWMLDALRAAVNQGRISRARIDQSARRILMLKARFGLLPPAGPHAVGSAAVRDGSTSVADADLPHGLSLA